MARIHEGKLVRIRPFREEELSIYSQWRQDSEVLGGFGAPALALSAEESKRFDESRWMGPFTTRLAVETLADGRLVGWVGYGKDHPLYESMARTFSLVGDKKDRGKGYATEARILLINYLFLSTALQRIYSETEEGNRPARRSLEKCGMQFEGVARHLFFDMGRWVNMALYSILRPEWEQAPLYEEYRKPFTDPWC